jgi:hypothetical protein
MCTHAYAISKKGAQKMVRFLRSEMFAYTRPIGTCSFLNLPLPDYVNLLFFLDHTFIHLGYHDLIKIFSVLPAVVLQTKDNPSDIDGGTGGLKTEWLVDSVLERVALWEAKMKDAER